VKKCLETVNKIAEFFGDSILNLILQGERCNVTIVNMHTELRLGKTRKVIDDNVKIDLRKMCCDNGNWMELAQDHIQFWYLAQLLGSTTRELQFI
jgi:hypothetical protein